MAERFFRAGRGGGGGEMRLGLGKPECLLGRRPGAVRGAVYISPKSDGVPDPCGLPTVPGSLRSLELGPNGFVLKRQCVTNTTDMRTPFERGHPGSERKGRD